MKKKVFSLMMALVLGLFGLAQAQVSLPYSEGFENGMGSWTMSNCNSSTGVTTSSSYIHSGSAAFAFHWTTTPPQYLISPEITGATGGLNVEFYYKAGSSGSYSETFQVGYSTTTNEVSAFTFGEEITAPAAADWATYTNTFPAGTKYVAINCTSYDRYYLCIDDFSFTATSGGGGGGEGGETANLIDFEDGQVPAGWNNDATYPWSVVSGGPAGNYLRSGNSGVNSSTSSISATVTYVRDGSISFLGGCFGEGTSTAWDKCIFSIDGEQQFAYGALQSWDTYTFDVAAGEHTFTWSYTKDSSLNPTGDFFGIDDVNFDGVEAGGSGESLVWDFEDGTLQGWTVIDADGDGFNWMLHAPDPSYTGDVGHEDSDYYVYSQSYDSDYGALTPDNYFVSPQVQLGGTFSFWAQAQDPDYAAEHFGVAVSTTSNTSASAFTMVPGAEWTMTSSRNGVPGDRMTRSGNRTTQPWYQYTVDLSAYSGMGYVAIRHFDCSDMFYLNVDDIELTAPAEGPTVEYITEVYINNFVEPVWGEPITQEVTIPEDANYTILDYGWFRYPHGYLPTREMHPDQIYNDTLDYVWAFNLVANEGYAFSPSYVAYINGSTDLVLIDEVVTPEMAQLYPEFPVGSAMISTFAFYTYEEGLHTLSTYGVGDNAYESIDRLLIERPNGAWMEPYHFQLYNDGTEDVEVVLIDFLHNNGYFSMAEGTEYPFTVAATGRPGVDLYINTSTTWTATEELNSLLAVNTTERSTHLYQIIAAPYTPYCPDVVEMAYHINNIDVEEDWSMWTSEMWYEMNPNVPYELHDNYTLPFPEIPEGYDAVMTFTLDHDMMVSAYVSDAECEYGPRDGYNGKVALYRKLGDEPVHPMADNYYDGRPFHNDGGGSTPAAHTSIDFETGNFSQFNNYTNNSAYPWVVNTNAAYTGTYGMMSGNAGVGSSNSTFTTTVNYATAGTVSFDYYAAGEGGNGYSIWDKCIFQIDGEEQFRYGAVQAWNSFSADVAAGEHTFTWIYEKDGSVNPTGDYFAVDNIVFDGGRLVAGNRNDLTYDFEEGTLEGWTNIDADGDGNVWLSSTAPGIYHNSGVDLTGTGHNSSDAYVISGSYANQSYQALYPDNYLVSPQVALGGSITFWACGQDDTYCHEHFGVAVSTTSNTNASSFTTIQEWTINAKGQGAKTNNTRSDSMRQTAWTQYTVDLSAYAGQTGYVAIRHFNCSDQFILNVDDITITTPDAPTPVDPDQPAEHAYSAGPVIQGLNLLAGTYYLVASSTCEDFEVTIDFEELPCPIAAVTNIYPVDNDTAISPNDLTLRWRLNDYCNEWRLIFSSTYWPEDEIDTEHPSTIVTEWSSDLQESFNISAALAEHGYQLWNNTNYFWRIEQRSNPGTEYECYTPGPVFGFTTCLNAPTNLQATNTRIFEYEETVTLSWTAIQDRTYRRYRIYMDDELVHQTPNNQVVTSWAIPQNLLTYNMGNDHGYIFKVTAVYDEGESPMSNPVEIWVSGNGTVSGYVWEQDETTPIGGVTVTITGTNEFGQTETYTYTTDNNGYYHGNIHAGTYGYAVATMEHYQNAETIHELPLDIVYDEETDHVDFIMDELFIAPAHVCAQPVYVAGVEGDSLVHVWWDFNFFTTLTENFEDWANTPFAWQNDATYPWALTTEAHEGTYAFKSGNAGVHSSSSTLQVTVDIPQDGQFSFEYKCEGEGTYTYYDHCDFVLDGQTMFSHGADLSGWQTYSMPITAGSHTFKWSYTKDSSVNPTGDCFTIDNIVFVGHAEERGERSLHHYNIYRTDCYNDGPYNSGNTVFLSTVWRPDTAYMDVNWPQVPVGVYKYGVSAVYAGNYEGNPNNPRIDYPFEERESEIVWSDLCGPCIDKDMYLENEVSVNVVLNSADSPEGVRVDFFNLMPGEQFNHPQEGVTLDQTGYYLFPRFRKGTYMVTVSLPGYYTIEVEEPIWEPRDLRYVLTEIICTVQNLYVSRTGWAMWDPQAPCPGGAEPTPGPTPGPTGNTTFTEGFEGSLNGWNVLTVNADGGEWLHSSNHPLGYDYTDVAHGGTGFAMCYSYIDYDGAYNTNSYLYTPQKYDIVNGSTLTFWADNANDSYPESFSVCISTADTPTASSFTQVWSGAAKANGNAKANNRQQANRYENWRSHSIDLSAYAGQSVWIAFHDVNYDMYEVWIDDVTLSAGRAATAERHLEGYKIMCTSVDGEPIFNHNTPADQPFCQLATDQLVEGNQYKCKVAAIYSTGMSEYEEVTWQYEPCDHYAGTVNGVTAEGNTITWDYPGGGVTPGPGPGPGDATTFNVGFEGGLPTGWTTIDGNNDGYTWCATSAIPTTWTYYASLTLDWYHNGSDAMCSGSYINGVGAITPNEYLVSPQVTLAAGSQLSFWVAATDASYPADHFGVFVSTTGTNPSDFTSVQEWTLTGKSANKAGSPASRDGRGLRIGTWYNYTVDLSAYAGQAYIAFRHFNCNDQYIMCLDDVTLSAGAKSVAAGTFAALGHGHGELNYDDREGNWYYYDNGTNYDAIGLQGGGGFYWGIMFPAGTYTNGNLTKVSYYDATASAGTVTIFQGGTAAPGTQLYAQNYTTTGAEDVIEINMAQPVAVDNSQNLWVVMHNTSGQYVASYDGVSPGQTNGSWLSTDNATWYGSLYDATGGSYGGNWNLRAYIEEGTTPTPTPEPAEGILGAMIFVDGEWEAFVEAPINTYTYDGDGQEICVRIVYDGTAELPSNNFYYAMSCEECIGGLEPTCEPGAPIYAEVTDDDRVRVYWDDQPTPQPGEGTTFMYDFENSSIEGLTTIDADGDGYNWVLGSAIGGIYLVDDASLAGSGHNASNDMICSGSYSNATGSALSPNNFLVFPQSTIVAGSTFSFWACGQDANYVAEHFGVAVSTEGNTSAADFTTVAEWTMTAKNAKAANAVRDGRAQGNWHQYNVDLSDYAGMDVYIAIRHFNCTDMFILDVDDVELAIANKGNRDGIIGYNIYRSENNVDYAVIGTVDGNATEYFDNPGEGTFYYQVTALYDGCESEPAVSGENPNVNYVMVGRTGIGENSAEVNLFPNPTKGNVTIQAVNMHRITVVSVLGQVVFDTELDQDEYILNMSKFNTGMYMVRVYTDEGVTVKRVTVLH